ncbi:amidohydrolase [Bacillus sp. DNRA2]|uniref:M20 family metallopeptidase n=1 Tax=Bacillus sp. DNRA2 TaxID=2723053 RepID=UPI00145D5EB4|nr:M20 family metallopeptidase [Bacillus sp. DNRA2]NMD72048.1 amidohydrolase [Bacillus sp. DNRA2]
MLEELYTKLQNNYSEMVSIRRYLHQHPELSFQETETANFIQKYYETLGIEVQGKIGGNGVVAKIYGAKPGRTIALRADFDALPIQDEKDVPYKSKVPGVMHACGHDGHTATLLVLAKSLHEMRAELEGTYVMIHQHAEEYTPGGAKPMIEAGCLDGVDAIFGTHLWATTPIGTIQSRVGPIMAAADRFEITVKGKGGHGAQPQKTKDALVTAAQLVVNLQQIVSRKVNPIDSAVVTIGSFVADNAFNVIADKAKLIGTVRTFKEETRQMIETEIERITKGTCLTNDCGYEYVFERGYPALVNHKDETEFLIDCAQTVLGVEIVEAQTEPHMGGEDFAYYLEKVKGCFFFTGAGSSDAFPHHHPRFDIDERAMLIAAKTLATVAINYQKSS